MNTYSQTHTHMLFHWIASLLPVCVYFLDNPIGLKDSNFGQCPHDKPHIPVAFLFLKG